jgi:hypothetical protein
MTPRSTGAWSGKTRNHEAQAEQERAKQIGSRTQNLETKTGARSDLGKKNGIRTNRRTGRAMNSSPRTPNWGARAWHPSRENRKCWAGLDSENRCGRETKASRRKKYQAANQWLSPSGRKKWFLPAHNAPAANTRRELGPSDALLQWRIQLTTKNAQSGQYTRGKWADTTKI